MKNLLRVLSQDEFPYLMFFISLILFNWPFLVKWNMGPRVFLFYYITWVIVISLLFLLTRGQTVAFREEKKEGREPEDV